mgnify:FL=1
MPIHPCAWLTNARCIWQHSRPPALHILLHTYRLQLWCWCNTSHKTKQRSRAKVACQDRLEPRLLATTGWQETRRKQQSHLWKQLSAYILSCPLSIPVQTTRSSELESVTIIITWLCHMTNIKNGWCRKVRRKFHFWNISVVLLKFTQIS